MSIKHLILLALPVAIGLNACGGKKKKTENTKLELKTSRDSASYAAGLNEGERMMMAMKQAGADTLLDKELFIQGFTNSMRQTDKFGKELAEKVLRSYFGKLQEKQLNKFKEDNAPKKAESEKFMAENKTKPGIVTTESGLQYEVIKKGSGATAKIGNKVKVHYTGKLLDGTTFDSSEGRDPFEFELQGTGLVQGWIEALQLMNKGSKYKLYIPYELGYGEMGNAPTIPPYAVLVFDLELIDVK